MASSKYPAETRIFENDFAESLTRSNPVIPILFWTPVSFACAYYAYTKGTSAAALAGIWVFGFFAWTLAEYLLHRYLFHFIPKNMLIRKYYYLVHQVHHDAQEYDRLIMPVPLALVIAVPTLAIMLLAFGPVLMWGCFAGFIIGYLCYDYIHFYTHFAKPKTRIGKGLRRRHQQHHHAYPDKWYGVSSPLWDYIFRTHVPKGTRPRPTEKPNIDWGRQQVVNVGQDRNAA